MTEPSRISEQAPSIRSRIVTAAARGLPAFVARSIRAYNGENAELLRREQARTLRINARLFSPIGIVAAALLTLDVRAVRHEGAFAVTAALVVVYLGWLGLAETRRLISDLVFIRTSIGVLFVLGISWGALVLLVARAGLADRSELVITSASIIALISAPMITAPFLAALAFWLPMAIASAVAVYGLIGPPDDVTFALFGGYALFTFGGICVSNFTLHERAVGRISLARGVDTINALLGEARQGAAGWSWETDEDGRLLAPSEQFLAILGEDAADATGRTLASLIGRGADADAHNGDVVRALAARSAFRDFTVAVSVNGETRWWSLSGHPRDEAGLFVGYRGVGVDVTERRRSDARMHALATRDSLTGINNRQALLDHLETACAAARTGAPGTGFALVLIDLDRFKDVNDRYGHAIGDELLKSVAQRMRQTVRGEDRVARLGGDEFAIMLARAGETEASEIVGRQSTAFADCVRLDARTASVGATFGVALCPRHGVEPAQLLRNADLALYDGKRRERGSLAVFRRELETAAETRQTMQEGLRAAIDSGAVRLLFRPTVWTGTGVPVSAEPVATWSTPGGAILSSLSLFRLAAEGQLLGAFAHAFLQRSLEAATGWDKGVRLTFGLPAPLISAPALIDELAADLRAAGLPMSRIELAFRAGDLAGASDGVCEQVLSLRREGARLVLDEFGTGTLDLSLFRRFQFDSIRLHGRLLRELPERAVAGGVLRWILTLAGELGMDLVADGLANPEQLAKLRHLGVGLARGRAVHDIAVARPPSREKLGNLRPLSGAPREEMLTAVQSLLGGL